MRNWMKQLNRVIVLALVLVCLFGYLGVEADAYGYDTVKGSDGYYWDGWYVKGPGGALAKNKWFENDGYTYFTDSNGKAVTGWHQLETKSTGAKEWYYFLTANGRMVTGWQNLSDSTGGPYWFYFKSNGIMAKNEFVPVVNSAPDKTAYVDENGRKVFSSWKTASDGYTYYFGSDGIYDTGFQYIGNAWYYLGTAGRKETGWVTLNGETFYLNPNSSPSGQMVIGWKTIGTEDYYFNGKGVLQKNQTIDGYYVGPNGHKHTGWNGTTYYIKGLAATRTLTIKKSVTGIGQTGKEFSFTIKYTRNSTTTTETFKLKHNETKAYTLPYNTTYTVTETDYSGYTTSGEITSAQTLTESITKTITNKQEENTLTIKNTVVGADKEFSYTVTVNYADKSTYSLASGDASFKLKNGQSKQITLPRNATYTVKQTAISGYRSTADVSGTMDGNKSASFTNTQQITLKVTNTVVGADKAFGYTVVVGSKTYTGISLGNGKSWTCPDAYDYDTSYSVTQTSDAGYTTSSSKASGKLAAGVTAAFTNTQKKYNLTLSNTVIGEDVGITYSVTIGTEDKGTFTLTHGKTQVFENIPHGTTYSITRTDDLGYLTDDGVTRSGTLTQAATETYVNRQLVPLAVTNTVDGADNEFAYTVTIDGVEKEGFNLKNGEWAYPEVPCGLSYTVSQTANDNYKTDVPANYTGEVASGITVAFKNTQTPQLTVKNTVYGADAEFAYTVVIDGVEQEPFTLAPGEKKIIGKFLLDTPYSVTQTPNAAYHTTEPDNIAGAMNDNVDVEFINRELVSLTVSNTISGATPEEPFTYSVVIGGVEQGPVTLGNGGTEVFENIPFGTPYTVTQTTPVGYRNNGADTVTGTVESGTKAEFSNTQLLTLTVTNTVEGADGEFAYVVTINGEDQGEIKLTNGGTWTSEAYPYDAEYTVVQTGPEGFKYATTQVDSHSGKLTADATVAFTNVQMLKLTISNEVRGTDGKFAYAVTIGGVNQGEIELKNGETWTSADWYRYDSQYTVAQTAPEGYKYATVVTGSENATLAECTAVTYKNPQLLTLTITNQLTGEDKDFTYTVTLNGEDRTVTVEPNKSTVVEDIPYNTVYKIVQNPPENLTYNTQVAGTDEGELKDHAEVTYTNVQLVTLTLALDTTGNMANKDQEFEFVVTVGEDTQTVKLVDDGIWNKTVHFGTDYSITQTAVEGYETSINGEKCEEADSYTTEGALAGDTAVTFTNEKGFAIPTAVTLTVLPFLGMVLFGGGIGITQLLGGRKSRRGRYLDR